MKTLTVKFEGKTGSGKTMLMAILIEALANKKIEGIIRRSDDKHTLTVELADDWTNYANS